MILIQLVATIDLRLSRNTLTRNAFVRLCREQIDFTICAILLLEEMLHGILILRRIGRSELGHIFSIHVPAIGNGAVLADIEVSVNQFGGQGSIGGDQGVTLIPAQEDAVVDGLSGGTQHRLAGFAVGLIQGTGHGAKRFIFTLICHIDLRISIKLDVGIDHTEFIAGFRLNNISINANIFRRTLGFYFTSFSIKAFICPGIRSRIIWQTLNGMLLACTIVVGMYIKRLVDLHTVNKILYSIVHLLGTLVK